MNEYSNKYVIEVIEDFISFYKFDLSPYNQAYRFWFEKGMYKEIIVDFLNRLRIRANVRLIKGETKTEEHPFSTGHIEGINLKNPILFLCKDFKNTLFTITVNPDMYKDFNFFIVVLIHELAHLVLHSTFNNHRESEVATDLFVMTFGLYEEMAITKGQTYDHGEKYIKSEQVLFALRYIKNRRKIIETKGIKKLYYQLKLRYLIRSFFIFIKKTPILLSPTTSWDEYDRSQYGLWK